MKEQEQSLWRDLNFNCIIRRLIHEIPVILAAGLAVAMIAASVVQLIYKPEYTSTATVAVRSKSGNYSSVLSELSLTSEIADTFRELFSSSMFSNVAKSQLGVTNLPGTLSASVIPETNLLTLSVTANSPEDAFRTLNLLLNNYDVVSEYVFQNIVLKELTHPNLPVTPSNPQTVFAIAKKAFVIGCAAMIILILAVVLLADTVQTNGALQRKLDVKLAATIHHEEKNKTWKSKLKNINIGLLVTMPIVSFRFTEEVHRLGTVVESAMKKDGRKVILVTSTEENEGKSTVAANLALTLAQGGKRVLLIDADMHKAAQYKLLETEPKHELADMIRGKILYQPQYLENENIWVLFSRQQSSGVAEMISSDGMKLLMEKAREDMDYIVIDTPPMALFSDVEILADYADLSLLVVRQDTVPAGRLNDSVDILNQCHAELLGCVFNDVRSSSLSSDHYGYGYGHYGYGHYGYGHYGYGHYGYGHYGYGHYGYGYGSSKSSHSSKESGETHHSSSGTQGSHHDSGESDIKHHSSQKSHSGSHESHHSIDSHHGKQVKK